MCVHDARVGSARVGQLYAGSEASGLSAVRPEAVSAVDRAVNVLQQV
jgi:hypothetical protein